MTLARLNPVALISGAASGLGATCARNLTRRAQGGLILVDADEDGLTATADSLRTPPERVSMLALDAGDPARWAQACDFIKAQYGRLDWAIASAPASNGDLVDWGRANALNELALTARAAMSLMRVNTQGGAIVLTAPQAPLDGDNGLLRLMAALAAEAGSASIRINAITPEGDGLWRSDAPLFQDYVREAGDTGAALEAIAKLRAPLVRFAGDRDIARLVGMLLSDDSPISGATFVADGGPLL